MRWFKNKKISVKLISSFIVVSLFAGVIGVLGIINMRNVDSGYTDLYVDYGVATGDLGAAGIDFNDVRAKIRDVFLTDSIEEKERIYKEIQALDQMINEELGRFETSIRTEQTRQAFITLKDTLAKYNAVREKTIDLSLSGQNEQAIAVFYAEASDLAQNTGDLINQLFDSKQEVGSSLSDDLSAQTITTSTIMIIVVIIAVIVAAGLGIFISRMISQPVIQLVKYADKIADGNLDVKIEVDTHDEIGSLAAAFRKMSDNLNDIMSHIQSAAEQVASGSKQVSISSISLSQGATEQASSVEELTASIEEIASQTRQNANSSNEAKQLAEAAKENAIHGNTQMKEMLSAMDDINMSSENISKIIKVIDDIAFQTNILALNAAVEAARAGQHGKGFAVVAEEVRNLAARSAHAAKETTEMIEGSIKKVEGGTRIANETAGALQNIVSDVAKVANLIGDIATASNEQAIGINQINQGIMQVSQVVQANSATSEESAAASEELSSQADLLKEQVSRFELRKNHFGTLKGMEELSPELQLLFEKMSEKKRAIYQSEQGPQHETTASQNKKIALSDYEFGKY